MPSCGSSRGSPTWPCCWRRVTRSASTRSSAWCASGGSSLPRDRAPGAVIILDTVGELAECYRLADVVFVGGSLVPTGGHNMLEPALRHKPVLFGPYTSNFRESAELLQAAGGAIEVKEGYGLESETARLLASAELRMRMGEAGFAAVVSRQGAVKETLDLIERFLLTRGGGETPSGRTR